MTNEQPALEESVVTEDDLRRMQDSFLEGSKKLLQKHGHIGPVGFVITYHKHITKLFESGYGVEFIDPRECVHDEKDDAIAALIIDLGMNWKKLYHAVLNVFPKTQSILPTLLALGAQMIKGGDPYKRLMEPFLSATQLDEKDIIAATMRQICDKTEAFASIFHSEAWQRSVGPDEKRDEVPADLGTDDKSIEVLISSMETYAFARMLTVPVHRASSTKQRDDGKVEGFGAPIEMIDRPDSNNRLEGRLVRFLKPQEAR